MQQGRTLQPNTEFIAQDTIEGEVIVIHFPSGNYFALRGLATRIWHWLLDGHRTTAVVEFVCSEHPDADPKQLHGFIGELVQNGLLIESTDSEQSTTTLSLEKGVDRAFKPPALRRYDDMQELIILDPVHEVDDRTGWPEAR